MSERLLTAAEIAEPVEDGPVSEVPVQLSLEDEIVDDLSFGEWVASLPPRLEEARAA